MSPLTEPTKLTLAKDYTRPDDPDAVAYIAAVEAADGQALETATRMAINSFVKGCKADGIWPAIKASCILAGARTLAGALVPLVGAAPTNNNFNSGDYNRKTGLLGNGTNKRLLANRNNAADPQNSNHNCVWVSGAPTIDLACYIAGDQTNNPGCNSIRTSSGLIDVRNRRASAGFTHGPISQTGFIGVSRQLATAFVSRISGSNVTHQDVSTFPENVDCTVFSRLNDRYSDARLAFYSIGESLNLALLDARVTDLINAFGAAIP